MNIPGGWNITEDAKNYPVCNLPQEVATAFSEVTENLQGASYEPLMYLATQVVNQMNHMILCRETLSDREGTVIISTMVVNIPASGEAQIVTVNRMF